MDKENKKNCHRKKNDLTVLNDDVEFERHFAETHPPELELKNLDDVNTEGSFLDLSIGIKVKRSSVSIFNKQIK